MCPANFAATNPAGARAGARDARRKPGARPGPAPRGRPARPHQPDRRERVRSRPQPRGDARQRGVRERADPAHPVRAAHRRGGQAPAGDRAALHQQVLHPRPAAGELVRALCGRAAATRCSWCRGATCARTRAISPGTITSSSGVISAAARRRARSRGATRSTRSASASAARCSAPRSRSLQRKRKTTASRASRCSRRCSISRDTGQIGPVRRRGHASRRAKRRSARAGSCPGRSSRSSSRACAPTTSSGRTWSTTISRARRRRRSTSSTGTPTAPTCRARCTATTCATPISRTSCASRARSRIAARRSISARVELPVFVLATREDHIVPWRSAYRTLAAARRADKTFVLGASGHIAGVINPASKNRRSYWTSERYPAEPEDFLRTATRKPGQLVAGVGAMARAPWRRQTSRTSAPGNVQQRPIEAAPGRYVKQRIH